MALNKVTVTWNELDATTAPLGGWIAFQLSADLADQTDGEVIRRNPPKVYDIISGTGSSSPLVANDNVNALPAGTYYTVTVNITGQSLVTFTTQINFANGSTQTLAFLQANAALPVAQFAQYLPLPGGTAASGLVPVATGPGTATTWGNPGAGAYLPLAGGTMLGWLAPDVVTLTDGASVALNAALGNVFEWPLGGNHTLATPTNPRAGQIILVDIQQPPSGGPYTPSFSGAYSFGTDGQPSWSTAASAIDEIAFRYSALKSLWLCQGWKLGF